MVYHVYCRRSCWRFSSNCSRRNWLKTRFSYCIEGRALFRRRCSSGVGGGVLRPRFGWSSRWSDPLLHSGVVTVIMGVMGWGVIANVEIEATVGGSFITRMRGKDALCGERYDWLGEYTYAVGGLKSLIQLFPSSTNWLRLCPLFLRLVLDDIVDTFPGASLSFFDEVEESFLVLRCLFIITELGRAGIGGTFRILLVNDDADVSVNSGDTCSS